MPHFFRFLLRFFSQKTLPRSAEEMTDEDYQEFITGVERGTEYQVGEIWFNGYDARRRVLLEAKHWQGFQAVSETFWETSVREEILSQRAVADEVPIEWHFSTLEKKQMVDRFIKDDAALSGKITTVHTPFTP